MLSEGFYVAAMQSCPCHSVSVDRQPNLVCAVMRRPIMQLFQARVGEIPWGRARKVDILGTSDKYFDSTLVSVSILFSYLQSLRSQWQSSLGIAETVRVNGNVENDSGDV